MVSQFVAAGFCHSLELVVGQLSQFAPRCLQCVVKPVAGISHLINTENSLQTPFVKKLVVSHQRQPFDKRFYLFPNFREYRGVIRVVVSETMHLAAPIIVIVRLGKDEGIKESTISPFLTITMPTLHTELRSLLAVSKSMACIFSASQ